MGGGGSKIDQKASYIGKKCATEVKAYEIKRIAACFSVVLPKVSCLFFFFLLNLCSSKTSSWAVHSNMKHKQWCIIVCRSTAEYFQGSCSKVGGSCLGLSQRPLWYCSEQTQEARSMGCKPMHFVSPHRSFCLIRVFLYPPNSSPTLLLH